ncbi:MAG TPA: DUF4097 family beta strand repeat-containing protein [Terracidiphilus sp.]|nr:DUF4097 family beta strand repeat-containing protein [Terracidiphilus sp.]
MRNLRRDTICAVALAVTAGALAWAQSGAGDWQKSYSISGKASLTLSTGDASVDLHSCGGCRAIQVHVDWRDRNPSDFAINEFQTGDHVNFELKEKSRFGFHIGNVREPRVTVETPEALDLQARTSDGSLKINGVQGTVELHTSDGSVDVSDVSGTMRLTASDGSIHIHNVTGTLESRSSDGHATIDGKFTALQVHTSDGGLELTLNDGSALNTLSRVEGSDGSVRIRLPRTLAVDLDVHTSDGSIKCDLPVTMSGYDSSHSSGHNLRGHVNGGGVPLEIHTSDGSVSIEAL